ncbi:N-6 DNA Methylase [Thermoanaerobacter thermohydrosulfuricus]|nr:N-6 DNA Methylase [Thermoanaerobacter thermohydrosulfuricus]
MSLIVEIQKVHDFLYKEIGDTKILLPLMLTILDKYKEKKKSGSTNPINDLKNELQRLDRRMMEQTLQKIRREHSNLNPLLERLINDSLNAISPDRLPDAKIDRAKQRILRADNFLRSLEREEDFIGILFETLAAHSEVFDKKEGRFFTPKNIILTVVEIVGSLFERNSIEFSGLSVCDPCCGSARYLVHWANRLKREYKLSDEKIQQIYSNKLFGVDISSDVASWAAWNMIFHGDGAANIENADSLNWYGFLVHWDLIQMLLEELPEKIKELKRRYQQRDILEIINQIEENSSLVLRLKGKNEVDLESEEIKDLFIMLDKLIDLHHRLNLSWDVLDELSRRRDFKSIAEIMKLNWSNAHPEIKNGFDLVITNPPFGRGNQDLMVTNPFILCQYKLATELWLGDMSKEITEKLLEKQFGNIADFYRQCLGELGISEIKEEYEIKFEDLPSNLLRELATARYGVSTQGKTKNQIVEELQSKLNREFLTDGELFLNLNSLTVSLIKKLASKVLYEEEGGKSKVGEFLYEKIKEKLGREWITIEDVYDYARKITIEDSATGDKHTIYYDKDGNPILFKDALPKQVVFLEEFLRFVKEGGYIFTVVDTGVLSNSEDEYVRRFLYRNSRIHVIVEFPHNAFKAAGTGVKTAVILYQKMKNPLEDYEIFGSLPQNLGYILNKQNTPPDPDHNDLGKVLCDWRNYIDLGRMCEACREEDANLEECCDWYKKGYCPVWREKIEKADL